MTEPPKPDSLIYQVTKNNKNPITISLGLFKVLKVCTEIIENSKHHLKKTDKSNDKRNLKLVFSLHNR